MGDQSENAQETCYSQSRNIPVFNHIIDLSYPTWQEIVVGCSKSYSDNNLTKLRVARLNSE